MPFSVALKPIQTEIQIKPGGTFIQAYEVTNNSDSTLLLNTSLKPWIPVGTEGRVDYLHALPNPHLRFSFQNTDLGLGKSFYLKPRESRQLVLKMTLDPAAPEGDSYYTFFITQDLTNQIHPAQTQNSVYGQIGTHLLISSSTAESTPFTASLSPLSVTPRIKDILFTPLNISTDVINHSAFFFKTPLILKLTKNDTTVSEITLEPQNVLANYSRHFTTSLNPPFWPGQYQLTASLPAEFGSVSASTTFYVFPYSFLVLLLTFTFIFFCFRRFKKRTP